MWDVSTGTLKSTLTGHQFGVQSVSFSPDGSTLASGSGDGTVRLWDVSTGTLRTTLTGYMGRVIGALFSPDGLMVASVRGDDTVRVWDVSTGTLKAALAGHTDNIISVSFSPDGSMVASGGDDQTVRLWDVSMGTLKSTFTGHTRTVYSVSFSPDGTTLASGSFDKTVLLWNLAPAPPEPPRLTADVNNDGSVNIQDLVAVAAAFGDTGETLNDVNNDGQVNIQDLVAVAAAFGEMAAGAPAAAHLSTLSPETVQQWLTQAQQLNLTDATSQRGILFLEQLLLVLIPKETALLANYPNPFNPETWIPYQLVQPADVTLHIYAVDGTLVRTLSLGYKAVGVYHSRSRAVYWDGRNEVGEPVASGVYFYTLTAGDFTATRKMLIRK